MAVENLTATTRAPIATYGHGSGQTLLSVTKTVEVTAAASVASTYSFGNIPSDARFSGLSFIAFDDLASTGSPTVKVGLFPVDGNITADDDALNSGIDVATAAARVNLVSDIANYGKRAWELVSGQTTDPKGELEVKATIVAAALNTGGTITVEMHYILD
jgi:hypothetical protein